MKPNTVNECARILRMIRSYKKEQSVIFRVLRKHKEITDSEFDRIFSDSKITTGKDGRDTISRKKPKLRFLIDSDDAVILGGLEYGRERDKWLHLTQMMSICGLVEIVEKEGTIVYRIGGQAK